MFCDLPRVGFFHQISSPENFRDGVGPSAHSWRYGVKVSRAVMRTKWAEEI